MEALHTQIFVFWVSGTMIDRSVLDSRSKCHLGLFTTENLCGAKIKRISAAGHDQIEEYRQTHSGCSDKMHLQQPDIYTSRKCDFASSLFLSALSHSMHPLMCCVFKPVEVLLSARSPVFFRVYTACFLCHVCRVMYTSDGRPEHSYHPHPGPLHGI